MRRYNPDSYHPSNFDNDYCLKPPILLWLVVLFLSRGVALPIIVGLGHFANVDASAMLSMRGLWRLEQLIPAALAAPVLYALLRRTATASRAVRWIWGRGRILLALSAGADIALSGYSLLPLREFDDQSFLLVGGCVLDAYALLYLLAARRIRDTFSDFPPPLPSA